jgi:carbon storage regulator
MLVLSRRTDETIEIEPNIRVTILDIRNGIVRVGIDAPKDQKILRGELIQPTDNDNNDG